MSSRSTNIFLGILLFLAVILGYNYFAKPFAHLSASNEAAKTDDTDVADENVKSPAEQALEKLTSEQKIAQLFAWPIVVKENPDEETLDKIENFHPGFVTLFGSNLTLDQTKKTVQNIKQLYAGLPVPLMAVDHEGGTVQRLSGTGFTKLPAWKQMCGFDTQKRVDLLTNSARELSDAGINVVFAPVLDIAANNAVLGSRVCSDDVEDVFQAASEYITVFVGNGIFPVVKHFPGIGSSSRDLHTSFESIELEADDIVIYRDILHEYPQIGVMSTHVGVNSQDPSKPCSLSTDCVGELVNTFDQALPFTDALEMKSASYLATNPNGEKSMEQITLEALGAGNVVLVFGPKTDQTDIENSIYYLAQRYDQSETFRQEIDAKVLKVLRLKGISDEK